MAYFVFTFLRKKDFKIKEKSFVSMSQNPSSKSTINSI